MLLVPTGIITLGILPGFISSTIQKNWAIVAPPNAITLVIQEVLKFWSTLTKLSPSIGCDVPSGGCCMFTAGLQVDRLKQAFGSVSETPNPNLAHSCWQPIVLLFLSAFSRFAPRLGHLGCHLGPGLSLDQL